MSFALADRALDWMLRRLRQAVPLEHDLVIVHDLGALAHASPSVDIGGGTWRVARVTGELTLRDALPEADRLIALVPAGFPPLPMDIAGRTYLGRILDVRADDLVAAVAGRFCEALVDEGLAQGVFDLLDSLPITVGRWSLGELVTAREVRSVLVGTELGAARLDRVRDWELLARWIVEGAPSFRAPTLVRAALEEAQPRSGRLLAWALTDGTLAELCTAGALMGSPEGEAAAPSILDLTGTERAQLAELVESALREVLETAPARAQAMLIEAERIARRVELDAKRHRLLRVPLEGALSRWANDCREGKPPDDVTIDGAKRNLHARELAGFIGFVADLARLARFQRVAIPSEAGPQAWFAFALRDVAWADLAYRRVRRGLEAVPGWLTDPASQVMSAWMARRDALNADFAECLAAHWATLAKSTDMREPLALHQITRCLVRRLVDDGRRVLLLVLDGCDLASFLELLETMPAERPVGLTLPDVKGAALRDDVAALGAFSSAISPIPTLTSHSRRALFAGEIPGNAALDAAESAAAAAALDQRAWAQNTALGELPRRLFLKGDLGTAAEPLLDALRAETKPCVLAAVLNAVDDSLSSKETTALPPWSLARLGANAEAVLQAAIEREWCVLVTADHGHTPFVSSERKARGAGLGHRICADACEGSVTFRSGPLPQKPLHLLTRFGSWMGQQRRGFHGGAGIEEVAVPLAFLGAVRGEQEGRAAPPPWWWAADGIAPSLPRREPGRRVTSSVPPRPSALPVAELAPPKLQERHPRHAPDPRLESLTDTELLALSLVEQNGAVRLSAIAQHLKKPPMRASGFMQQLVRKLFELRCPCLSVEVLPDGDRLYRYQPVDRGT